MTEEIHPIEHANLSKLFATCQARTLKNKERAPSKKVWNGRSLKIIPQKDDDLSIFAKSISKGEVITKVKAASFRASH